MAWETSLEALIGREKAIDMLQPVEVEIFDENYEHTYVKAVISHSSEKLPEGEDLWVQDFKGRRLSEPWRIKIIERLPAPFSDL